MAAADNVTSLGILKVAVIGALIVLLIVLIAIGVYNYEARRLEERDVPGVVVPADVLRLQAAELEGYRWVDKKAGVVEIPIERAIELIASEERGR